MFAAVDRLVLQTLQTDDDATIRYKPVGGSWGDLDDAIFHDPDEPAEGSDLVFEGSGPQFSVHKEDCPNLQQGDMFERNGVEYIVNRRGVNESSLWVAYCRLG